MREKLTTRASTDDPRLDRLGGHDFLNPGDLVRFTGERGVFRFKEVWLPDGSLTAYGPLSANGEGRAQFRSFRPERLSRRDRAAERQHAAVKARLDFNETATPRRKRRAAAKAAAA